MKDYYGELLPIAAHDPQEAYERALEFLAEMRQETRDLLRQVKHVQELVDYLKERVKRDESREQSVLSEAHLAERELNSQDLRFLSEARILSRNERPIEIIRSAIRVAQRRRRRVTPKDVLEDLRLLRRLDLGVQQPLSVIGTVLSRDNRFEKIGTNEFTFVGEIDDESDALPF